jgi:amidase
MTTSQASEICHLSAVEMARLMAARSLSARDCVAAHLARVAQLNPGVNAIVTLVAEEALARAAAADEVQARGETIGPLHGLPIAHKDLQPTRGIRTTFGSRIFRDHVPDEDSLLVERMRAAGAICIGKTNTPEFGAGSQTYNEVFGATLNPWDRTKTCGGSSGGAAVSLACRMLPIADGTDLGGSLRNPASFCGVVGMRPSPGRVPTWPALLPWSPLNVEGPLARTVEDLALALSAMAGPDARSPLSLETPGARFRDGLGRDFTGVRIAWWRDLGGVPVDRRVRAAVDAQRAVFESLGCIVEEAEPDFNGADHVFRTLRAHATALRLADQVRDHRDLIKDTLLQEFEAGNRLSARDVGLAEVAHGALYHRMRCFMERYDFFILPVCQVLPFDVSQHWPTEIDGVKLETYIDWMKTCYYISAVGTPAISVPCAFVEKLPVGLQIVGRHRDDWGVLQMAHAFEQASGIGACEP